MLFRSTPTTDYDIVNKAYADSIASGLNYHQPVNYASTTTLPAYTYNNGTSGVGATITANANGALSLGGGSPTATQRVLVKNETAGNAPYNGVYVVTQAGNGSTPFILTRAMQNYLQTQEGAEADIYQFVVSEVYRPLGLGPGAALPLRAGAVLTARPRRAERLEVGTVEDARDHLRPDHVVGQRDACVACMEQRIGTAVARGERRRHLTLRGPVPIGQREVRFAG